MKLFVITLCLLGFAGLAKSGDSAPESLDVREAIKISPIQLKPQWTGTLSLVLPKEYQPKAREVTFTHFIRSASAHSETDCPRPHKPAIFHYSALEHGQYAVGDTAIFDTLHIDWIKSWKTFGDVLMTLPDVIRAYDEDNQTEEIAYWYNTFDVSEGSEEMEVFFSDLPDLRIDPKPISRSKTWRYGAEP